jgi:hypothetical protein
MFSVGKCVKNFLLSFTLALIILGDSFLGFFVAELSDGVSRAFSGAYWLIFVWWGIELLVCLRSIMLLGVDLIIGCGIL